MSRGAFLRLLLVLGLLAGCVALALNVKPRLGLDLRGGTQIMLQAKDTNGVEANPTNVDRAIEILRGRVDALGVTEPTLARVGEDRILVELPDVQDPEQAKEVIGRTAQLTVHPVIGQAQQADEDPDTSTKSNVQDTETGEILQLGPAALSGAEINSADAVQPQQGVGWEVSVDFDGKGSDAFAALSRKAACEEGDPGRIAIVLDGGIISSPDVSVPCGSEIRGGTNISGSFSEQQARDLALLIEGGALPLEVEQISSSTVGPTLGDAAIEASAKAGLIGLVLTGIFIVFVYRFVGFLAALALTSYAVLAYALLLVLGSTLTLPGLAGFVLAIGLAIDANVLVFERAREEYAENPRAGMRRALQIGFNKAWTAIIDSNVTTLLAAALLFILASGPVKGFGVTLSIGVVASMISALVIARVLTEIGVASKYVTKHPKVSGLANKGRVREWLDRTNPDLMKRRSLWLGISGAALVLSLVGIFGAGLNLGLEFTGGRVVDYTTNTPVSADRARELVADAGVPEAVVQESTQQDQENPVITVRAGDVSDGEVNAIQDALAQEAGGADVLADNEIAASLGKELRNKALLAFGIALAAQMLYLAIRFKWTFGVSAVLAMFHDVVIVTGVFAWLGKPIDGIFLAAALTIIGLSVNDTVVVFDRIRERWHGTTSGDFASVANKAAVETMPRTVNTGLGAMFILAALAVLGGDSLRDFSIALLLGLLIGTYSSVFTATPLLTYLQQRWPLERGKKEKRVRDPQDSGAVV